MENNKNYESKDIEKLRSQLENGSKKRRQEKYVWNEMSESSLIGWKNRNVTSANERLHSFYLSPDGTSYRGVLQALRYMIKENYSSEAVAEMAAHLPEEGWIAHEKLPRGWHIRLVVNRGKN